MRENLKSSNLHRYRMTEVTHPAADDSGKVPNRKEEIPQRTRPPAILGKWGHRPHGVDVGGSRKENNRKERRFSGEKVRNCKLGQ